MDKKTLDALIDEFTDKYPHYKSYRFEYEYPGYFSFSNKNNSVKFTPDHSRQGEIDISVYGNDGRDLFSTDEKYKEPLTAEQLFNFVKPVLD